MCAFLGARWKPQRDSQNVRSHSGWKIMSKCLDSWLLQQVQERVWTSAMCKIDKYILQVNMLMDMAYKDYTGTHFSEPDLKTYFVSRDREWWSHTQLWHYWLVENLKPSPLYAVFVQLHSHSLTQTTKYASLWEFPSLYKSYQKDCIIWTTPIYRTRDYPTCWLSWKDAFWDNHYSGTRPGSSRLKNPLCLLPFYKCSSIVLIPEVM